MECKIFLNTLNCSNFNKIKAKYSSFKVPVFNIILHKAEMHFHEPVAGCCTTERQCVEHKRIDVWVTDINTIISMKFRAINVIFLEHKFLFL